jgi:hypothetical protein
MCTSFVCPLFYDVLDIFLFPYRDARSQWRKQKCSKVSEGNRDARSQWRKQILEVNKGNRDSRIHLWIYFSLTDVDNAFSSTVFENLCFLHWLRESLFPLLTTRISVSFIDFQNLCFLYCLWESLFPSLTLSISVSFNPDILDGLGSCN